MMYIQGGFYGQKQRRRKPQNRQLFLGRPFLRERPDQRRENQPSFFHPFQRFLIKRKDILRPQQPGILGQFLQKQFFLRIGVSQFIINVSFFVIFQLVTE
ncbi:hypothetical protein K070079E91_36920 [Eisenbergiella porci]